MSLAAPFLLLPGHMCDARLWSRVIPNLARNGIGAVSVDFGDGGTISEIARYVLNGAPEAFVAVGFSMGGIVALEIARQAPERLLGLVLADTNPGPDLLDRASARLGQQQRVRSGALRNVVLEDLKPQYFGASGERCVDIRELVLAMALDLGADVFLRQSEALRHRPDARPVLSGIRCPTLLVCGAEDALCPPAWHFTMAEDISRARVAIVEGAGHMLPLERPDEFSAILVDWAGHHFGGKQ